LCRPVQAWRAQPSGTEIVHVCIFGVAGLGRVAQHSRDCAGLCRPWGYGPAVIMQACANQEGPAQRNGDRFVFVCPAQQALGAWPAEQRSCRAMQAWVVRPNETELVQLCAVLEGTGQWNGDCTCVYLWRGRPWGSGWHSRDCVGPYRPRGMAWRRSVDPQP
jgi:hypothetical protein